MTGTASRPNPPHDPTSELGYRPQRFVVAARIFLVIVELTIFLADWNLQIYVIFFGITELYSSCESM